jgi:hypothetical protein
MEAHAGAIRINQLREPDPREAIRIPVRRPKAELSPVEPTAKRLRFFRKRAWADDPRPRSVPGSDHSLLILPPKAYWGA